MVDQDQCQISFYRVGTIAKKLCTGKREQVVEERASKTEIATA